MIFYLNSGQNRVWYRAKGFQSGLSVQVRLVGPDFGEYVLIDLTEWKSEGMYWFIFDFDKPGTWLGIIYEDGEKATSNTFHIDTIPGVVTHTN